MKQPLYKKIYKSIVDKIATEEYLEGDRLPTELELAETYGVSRITSKKALDQLALDGYIKRIQGKGSYVLKPGEVDVQKSSSIFVAEDAKEGNEVLTIGVIMSDFNSQYGVDILSSMEKEIDNNNGFMLLKRTYDNQDIEKTAIEKLIKAGIDGLIIIPVHGKFYNPTILKLILDEFPVVVVDRQLQGLPTSFVGTDNKGASEKAVNYLFDAGYTNIAFVSAPIQNTVLKDRVEGIKNIYSQRGEVWDDDLLWLTDIGNHLPHSEDAKNREADLEELMTKIKSNPGINCIFALEYGIANYLRIAIKRLGKKIPNDIAIICFDEPVTVTGESYFTHIKQDEDGMGQQAVRLLLNQIEEGQDRQELVLLEAKLLTGKTT